MQTIGIKNLQTNPALLTKALSQGGFSLITKHGVPIGIAVGFDDQIVEEGLRHSLVLKAFSSGDLSLGSLAHALGRTREETLETLGVLGIPVADYPLEDEISSLEELGL